MGDDKETRGGLNEILLPLLISYFRVLLRQFLVLGVRLHCLHVCANCCSYRSSVGMGMIKTHCTPNNFSISFCFRWNTSQTCHNRRGILKSQRSFANVRQPSKRQVRHSKRQTVHFREAQALPTAIFYDAGRRNFYRVKSALLPSSNRFGYPSVCDIGSQETRLVSLLGDGLTTDGRNSIKRARPNSGFLLCASCFSELGRCTYLQLTEAHTLRVD